MFMKWADAPVPHTIAVALRQSPKLPAASWRALRSERMYFSSMREVLCPVCCRILNSGTPFAEGSGGETATRGGRRGRSLPGHLSQQKTHRTAHRDGRSRDYNDESVTLSFLLEVTFWVVNTS